MCIDSDLNQHPSMGVVLMGFECSFNLIYCRREREIMTLGPTVRRNSDTDRILRWSVPSAP